MYNTHGIECQKYSQRSAKNMAEVILMASLSIKQPWGSIGKQLADVRLNKVESKALWHWKKDTYRYLESNKYKMYAQMMAVINSKKTDKEKAISLMNIFLKVNGLGMAKAGFVCQLTAGLVGCMDSHNIKKYNVDIKTMSLNQNPKTNKGLEANARKVITYIDMCHDYGTDNMWNSWCSYIATTSKKWQDANHVSEVHYTYLTGE